MFRAIWLAGLVSNVGTWMHMVAEQWQMTSLTSSPATISLLVTTSALPAFALALPAGALADVVDRRNLIVVSQLWQALTAAVLGVITLADAVTPAGLLVATLLLSIGANFSGPAMMAVLIELVDRRHLPAAMSLGSLSGTVSQALGPAVGGLIVAALGSGAVYLLNAASFLGTVVVFAFWRQRPAAMALPPEHVYSAVRTGVHYLASVPDLRKILLRLAAHILGFGLVQAALPILARSDLGTGSGATAAAGLHGCRRHRPSRRLALPPREIRA
jgi:MFS family permease